MIIEGGTAIVLVYVLVSMAAPVRHGRTPARLARSFSAGATARAQSVTSAGGDGGRKSPEHLAQDMPVVCGSQRLPNIAIYDARPNLNLVLISRRRSEVSNFVQTAVGKFGDKYATFRAFAVEGVSQ
jgi:hypothetical protein